MTAGLGGSAAGGGLSKVWFPYWKPKPGAALRLFCFPFAGGSASAMHRWADLGPSIEVVAVQYPGRETRFQEPPVRTVTAMIEALGPVMLPLLDRPFAFFGYSLGTTLCLQLAYWLRRAGAPAPRGLMMAAGTPPGYWKPRGMQSLPDEAVIAMLRDYGAAPPQVLAHEELMKLLLPMVRADFEMLDTYAVPEEEPLSVPLAVWGGTEDLRPPPHLMEAWRGYTTRDFTLQLIPGGHFFLFSAAELLREAMERTLLRWSSKGP